MARLRSIIGLVVCASLGVARPVHADAVTDWNARTLSCSANRPGAPGLMDIALVQAAVHDAVQAIQGRFDAYRYANPTRLGIGSPAAAAAAASYRMLVGIYGASSACLAGAVDPAVTYAGDAGLQAGYEAAAVLLPLYRPFFVASIDPFLGGTAPGEWRPTPGVTQGVNTFMAETEPFVLMRASQFRPEPPYPLTSTAYLRDYNEVKELGSLISAARTAEQTDMARFWTAFGPQWFGTLRAIANAHVPDIGDKARLLALAALAAADSQIAVYDTKYYYNFWRPITAIREGDNDGNAETVGDPTWTPFLQTPPYPDHSSGANAITGSITTILQLFFGTDDFAFTVSSPNPGLVTNPRSFTRFSDAAQEVVDVRIWQGIHFRRAEELGRLQGERIAHWTFQKFLRRKSE
jgi:PAP2 superfamily